MHRSSPAVVAPVALVVALVLALLVAACAASPMAIISAVGSALPAAEADLVPHDCWVKDGRITGCSVASGSGTLFGSATGDPVTCFFHEPLGDARPPCRDASGALVDASMPAVALGATPRPQTSAMATAQPDAGRQATLVVTGASIGKKGCVLAYDFAGTTAKRLVVKVRLDVRNTGRSTSDPIWVLVRRSGDSGPKPIGVTEADIVPWYFTGFSTADETHGQAAKAIKAGKSREYTFWIVFESKATATFDVTVASGHPDTIVGEFHADALTVAKTWAGRVATKGAACP